MAKPIPSTICGYDHTSSRQDLSHIRLGEKRYALSEKQRKRLRRSIQSLNIALNSTDKKKALLNLGEALLLVRNIGKELTENKK